MFVALKELVSTVPNSVLTGMLNCTETCAYSNEVNGGNSQVRTLPTMLVGTGDASKYVMEGS